tara:strand:- start:517 stop:1065 length:549 start_codon:yes stop_codon:yes gene_type:complete
MYYNSIEKFERKMKLTSVVSCKNMVAFNSNNQLHKYNNVLEMLEEYNNTRLVKYTERKEYIIKEFNREIDLLKIKVRFIDDFINDNIQIIKKRKAEIESQLDAAEYPKIDESFDYLLKMPIYSLSLDKLDELNQKIANLESELASITAKSEVTLWREDIDEMERYLDKSTKKIAFKVKSKKV